MAEEQLESQTNEGQGEGGEDQQPDPVHNLKSEFSRKFENVTSQLEQQNAQFEQILSMIQSQQQQQQQGQQASTDDLDDDIAYDSSKLKQYVNSTAQKVADDIVKQREQVQTQRAAVVQQISGKYPEFNDQASPAYQKAIELHNKLDQSLQGTPQGAKMAMLEAAAELGLVPADKRQKGDAADDFSLSGSKGASSQRKGNKGGEDEVDPKTVEFARLLNPNKSEKELKEGLKKANQRKNWSKWS